MARITIEDCMEQVPNRFQLVRMASIRAKQLKKGARPLLSTVENKEVVTSLREIAAGLVTPGEIEVPAEPGFDALAEGAAEAAAEEAAVPSEAGAEGAGDAPVAAEAEPTPEG